MCQSLIALQLYKKAWSDVRFAHAHLFYARNGFLPIGQVRHISSVA